MGGVSTFDQTSHRPVTSRPTLRFRFQSVTSSRKNWAPLVAQLVEKLPAMQETWVRSLGWEDPLEKGKATPPPVFWPGEFHGLYSPWGRKELDMTELLSLSSKYQFQHTHRGLKGYTTLYVLGSIVCT